MADGRGAMDVLSALGPVGILAGRFGGDVLTAEGIPLPPRGPRGAGGTLEGVSLGAYCESVARGMEGEAFARNAACGTVGGTRDLNDGP